MLEEKLESRGRGIRIRYDGVVHLLARPCAQDREAPKHRDSHQCELLQLCPMITFPSLNLQRTSRSTGMDDMRKNQKQQCFDPTFELRTG